MTLWQMMDVLAMGWNPLRLQGSLPIDEARHNIESLDEGDADDEGGSHLRTRVSGESVQAWYESWPVAAPVWDRTANQMVWLPRPVFYGRLRANGGSTTLDGTFGARWDVRVAGLVTCVIAVILVGAAFLHDSLGALDAFAFVPVAFIVLSLFERAAAPYDIANLTADLNHALNPSPE